MILHPSSLFRHFDFRSKTPIWTTACAAEITEICNSHKPWGSIHCDLERRCPLNPDPLADPANNRGSYPCYSGDPSARTPRKIRHTPGSAFGRVRSCSPFNFHKPRNHLLRHHCPASRGDIGVRVCRAHAHLSRCRFGCRGLLQSSSSRPDPVVQRSHRGRPLQTFTAEGTSRKNSSAKATQLQSFNK